LEIFSLTGAGFNCSAYQQPGLRRGRITNALAAGTNSVAWVYVSLIWFDLLFTFWFY